ncbi:MAG: Trk family potassium uptake protein [Halobacteriovoraceae bacterium]|nr:Trk family potassium uptake protein [Halobacteriovoraceae bacterium]
MFGLIQKLPFLLELFVNGSFILLYSLNQNDKLPNSWSQELIGRALQVGTNLVPIVLFFVVLINYLQTSSFEEYLRKHVFSFVVFIPMVISFGDIQFTFWLSSAHLLSSILTLYDSGGTKKVKKYRTTLFSEISLRPAQLVFLSFSGVILLGTFLLMLPVSSSKGVTTPFIDALFMSTSATCVTGLATLSLADHFSLFGQIIILILIQIGGLSIMTLYASMTILLGRSMDMKNRVIMQDLLDVSSLEELIAMIVDIIKYTFFIELWGGIVLTIAFTFEGYDFGNAFYYGFFHSVSAFCNAGLSLFNTSLENYATRPLIHGTVGALITLGGLGFIVLKELKEVFQHRKSFVRLSLHSRIVLITSFALTAGGTIMIFFGEFLNAFDSYSLWEKIQVSVFQSVTLRTAGFNTVPLTNLNTYTLYGMTLFMFIGASPGSTGGGVKTTSLAILTQSIISTLKGRKSVNLFDRVIPPPIVVRATALTFISILITSFFILLLMKFEKDQPFLTIFFEVLSASGTVGLSLGITPYLTVAGKLGIAILMFIGRIGPLTLVLALGEEKKMIGMYSYPEGRIMIG